MGTTSDSKRNWRGSPANDMVAQNQTAAAIEQSRMRSVSMVWSCGARWYELLNILSHDESYVTQGCRVGPARAASEGPPTRPPNGTRISIDLRAFHAP